MSVRPHPKQQTDDPKYATAWIIDYYPNGKGGGRKQILYRGSELDARELESGWRSQTKNPETLTYPRINETVPHFIEYYRLDHQPAGVERTVRSLKIIMVFFGRLQFTAITPQVIERYKRERMAEVKPTTINKELAALSSMCKWAVDMGYCQDIKVKRFPPKLTKAPLPDIPPRYEVLAFLNSLTWPKCGYMACMYFGGLRKTEASTMLAERIYLDRGVMLVVGKGNKERVVPIVGELHRILKKRLKEVPAGLIWKVARHGGVIKDPRKLIEWGCKRAGITRHFYPHKFRHAFGVHATESGVGLKTLQQVMGHSTSQVTEIYSHLAADALKKDMSKFG